MSREQQAVLQARKAFMTGRSKPLDYRIIQLQNLKRFIKEKTTDIANAVRKDLHKVIKIVISASFIWMPVCIEHNSCVFTDCKCNTVV